MEYDFSAVRSNPQTLADRVWIALVSILLMPSVPHVHMKMALAFLHSLVETYTGDYEASKSVVEAAAKWLESLK